MAPYRGETLSSFILLRSANYSELQWPRDPITLYAPHHNALKAKTFFYALYLHKGMVNIMYYI